MSKDALTSRLHTLTEFRITTLTTESQKYHSHSTITQKPPTSIADLTMLRTRTNIDLKMLMATITIGKPKATNDLHTHRYLPRLATAQRAPNLLFCASQTLGRGRQWHGLHENSCCLQWPRGNLNY
jgi:hypothetical protein